MVQIRFLSDYADVFLDSECVESDVFFISRRADKPSGENAISTSICLLACFSICLGNQHLPYYYICKKNKRDKISYFFCKYNSRGGTVCPKLTICVCPELTICE